MKDSIDFGSMEIPKLFRKLLIPTVLGMVFSAVFVITDGIFVGRGIGSDALAAVNITAPLFLISTGVGLMFGVGASGIRIHGNPHHRAATDDLSRLRSIAAAEFYSIMNGRAKTQ